MASRVRRGEATGPAEWLLVFLQARDLPPRAHLGVAVGPAEWLLVFLDGARMEVTRFRIRPDITPEEVGPQEPALVLAAGGASPAEGLFTERLAAQGR